MTQLTGYLPILAQAPEDKTGFWLVVAAIILVVGLAIGLLIFVAGKSRSHDIDDDGKDP